MSDVKNDKTIKSSGLRHGKMTGTSRSKNRRMPRSSKELLGYDSMLSNGIAFLGGDRWSVSPRISDINYQVATQDQQLDVVDRWGHFLNSIGENMGVRITVATCMLDPEEVTRSIAMPLHGDMLDGLRGDFNRNVRRRLAGRSRSTCPSGGENHLSAAFAGPSSRRSLRNPPHTRSANPVPVVRVFIMSFMSIGPFRVVSISDTTRLPCAQAKRSEAWTATIRSVAETACWSAVAAQARERRGTRRRERRRSA